MKTTLLSLFRGILQRIIFGGRVVDSLKQMVLLVDAQTRLLDAQAKALLEHSDLAEARLEWQSRFIKLACLHFDALDRPGPVPAAAELIEQRKVLLDDLARQEMHSDRLRSQIEQLRELQRDLNGLRGGNPG